MSSKIEDQIEAIIGEEQPPKPSSLQSLLWGLIGVLGVLFIILISYILFFLLRTAVLYIIVSLIGQ